jgi:hypothetical protein
MHDTILYDDVALAEIRPPLLLLQPIEQFKADAPVGFAFWLDQFARG